MLLIVTLRVNSPNSELFVVKRLMSENIAQPPAEPAKKAGYHHGDLKEALTCAAEALIETKGPEGFSMAECCRMAGVSTAAPYRHFEDREDLVKQVAARGFEALRVATKTRRDSHPPGSVDSIVAMGQAYVRFAESSPAVFRLMFAKHKRMDEGHQAIHETGGTCFMVLLEAVDAFREQRGLSATKTLDIALPLWTIVHGTACLLIDRDFDVVAPETDPDDLVRIATEGFLSGIAGVN